MKIISLIIILVIFQVSAFGQINIENEIKKFSCSCENEKAVREYFAEYENQQNFIAQCEHEAEEKQKSFNLAKPKRISGFSPIAVRLVKPFYPKTAKRLKVYGKVIVEVFTDEKGLIIYSKILKGNAFLQQSVRQAACYSKFTPILYCGKLIKARYLIKYIFTHD